MRYKWFTSSYRIAYVWVFEKPRFYKPSNKIEKRFKLPRREISLIKYWAQREKMSQSKLLESALKEFLSSR